MKRHVDGSVTLSAEEAADLKDIFDAVLAGDRLGAGVGEERLRRYMRFMTLYRGLSASGSDSGN